MSPFHGTDFLNSYKIDRKTILNQLDSKITEKITLSELIKTLLSSEKFLSNTSITKFTTEILLSTFLNKSQLTSNDKIILSKLVKSFEIKKKIFTEYDFNKNTFSIDYKNLRNYILFSLLCGKEFKNSRNLKYLNTALKLNDIISSKVIQISENSNLLLAFYAISLELSSSASFELLKLFAFFKPPYSHKFRKYEKTPNSKIYENQLVSEIYKNRLRFEI